MTFTNRFLITIYHNLDRMCGTVMGEPWHERYLIGTDVIEAVTNHIPSFLESDKNILLSDQFRGNDVHRSYEFLMLLLDQMWESEEAAKTVFFQFLALLRSLNYNRLNNRLQKDRRKFGKLIKQIMTAEQ